MKRTLYRLIAASSMALALTGCAGLDIGGLADPIVRVAETVTDESTSTAKGVTAGLASSDARDVLINRDYYGAIKAVHGAGKDGAGPQLLLDIEPMDGQPIVIHAKRFKLYAPPATGGAPQLSIAAPTQKKPTWLAVSQEARGWFRDAVVPWKSLDEGSETERLRITTNGEIRQTELGIMNNALTGSQDLAGQAIETYKPVPVHVPTTAAPTEPAATE